VSTENIEKSRPDSTGKQKPVLLIDERHIVIGDTIYERVGNMIRGGGRREITFNPDGTVKNVKKVISGKEISGDPCEGGVPRRATVPYK